MDPYEATKKVFSRIQSLDPENSSKIMGLLLIQDHGEKEMIRLAFGPENLLQSVVLKARQELGISPNTPSSTLSSNPFSLSRQNSTNSSSNSSRLLLPKGLKIPSSLSVSSLASPLSSASSPSWVPSNFHNNPDELISTNSSNDLIDEIQLQEQLSFLNDPPQQDEPQLWGGLHRRSCSVSDVSLGDDLAGSVLGWKPCLYYARGFCKNGASCRFLHGDSDSMVGSPSKIEMMEQCHELLRSKSMQHHKMMAASQIMASRANSFSYSGSKPFNLLLQQQQNEYQRAAAALMMGEDMNKFNRSRLSRNDFLMNGGGQIDLNHSSRQIYLTFPADSIFREEDVSNYFSIFGPVQDVRIPYQQKRMFGFVTFLYSDTVKIILAKGNPHFVCDSRVLVKPYKEKGKIPDKFRLEGNLCSRKVALFFFCFTQLVSSHNFCYVLGIFHFRKQQHQLQQMERGDFSACNSPTALDPRDPFENQLGSRIMYNNSEEVLWRRKLEEQADMQQAIELHSKRLMNLQLDVKRSQHTRALSAGAAPFPSPVKEPSFNQPFTVTDCASPDAITQEIGYYTSAADSQIPQQAVNDTDREKDEDHNDKGSSLSNEDCSLPESLEHNLPDSPFASPTKAAAKNMTTFTNATHVGSPSSSLLSSSLLPATSTLDLSASFKSCYFQMPRLIAKSI
ncbi:hypothetical protein V2J09_012077 [Rumex salicifolius]